MTIPPQPAPDSPTAAGNPYPGPAAGNPYPTPAAGNPYPAPDRRGNPAGLISVILVAATLLLQVVQAIATAAVFAGSDYDYSLYGLVTVVFTVLQGLVALAAVVLGAIGLAARGRPKALAGIGLGGGAVVLFGILAGQLTNALLVALQG